MYMFAQEFKCMNIWIRICKLLVHLRSHKMTECGNL